MKVETASSRNPSEVLMTRLSEYENIPEFQTVSSSRTEHFEQLDQNSQKRTEMISVKHVVQNVNRSTLISDMESISSSSISKRNIDAAVIVGSYVADNQTDRTSHASEKLSPNRQPRFV